jgi:hypothetical protein
VLEFSFVDLARDLRVNAGIMAIEFSKAIGLVTAITGATKRLSDARTEVKVNDVAIQLQGIVLDLQSEMMIIQSDYQQILRSRDDLEKKLVDQEAWDKERVRYHLEKIGGSCGFVYALNVTNPSVEPSHWICAHCYEDKKKSILQLTPKSGLHKWACPRCKTEFHIMGWPQ